jgi:hypothetical protein
MENVYGHNMDLLEVPKTYGERIAILNSKWEEILEEETRRLEFDGDFIDERLKREGTRLTSSFGRYHSKEEY